MDAPSTKLDVKSVKIPDFPNQVMALSSHSGWKPIETTREVAGYCKPVHGVPRWVNEWRTNQWRYLWPGLWRWKLAQKLGLGYTLGALFIDHIDQRGRVTPVGLASLRMVTISGAELQASAMAGNTSFADVNYHGLGIGATAPANNQTALVTEVTALQAGGRSYGFTEIPTGFDTTSRSIATCLYTGAPLISVREHAVFDRFAFGGGSMFDRSLFGPLALDQNTGLTFTFDCTFQPGT